MTRRIVANICLSLDGRYHGPEGPQDMGWVMPHAVSDLARDHLTSLWQPATTALLGRVNAEDFLSFWPTVVDQADADERDRGYAQWLVDAEKVVLSTTLTEAPWERTRIVDAPTAEVAAELRAQDGGDIVVFASASVITALLETDRVDRLALMILPRFLGGGPTIFPDGLPTQDWTLASADRSDDGALALIYDRVR